MTGSTIPLLLAQLVYMSLGDEHRFNVEMHNLWEGMKLIQYILYTLQDTILYENESTSISFSANLKLRPFTTHCLRLASSHQLLLWLLCLIWRPCGCPKRVAEKGRHFWRKRKRKRQLMEFWKVLLGYLAQWLVPHKELFPSAQCSRLTMGWMDDFIGTIRQMSAGIH